MSHDQAPLREPLPPAAARLLEEQDVAPADAIACVHTDIDRLGNYAPAWLVVMPDRLLVVSDGQRPEITAALAFTELEEVRTESGVGAGLLQARVGGVYVDLLRYSNRAAYRFERIARKLERHLRGEPLAITAADARDPRRCERCGLMLESPGEICPRCVSRGAVLARMLRLLSPYRRGAAAMMLLLIGGIALDLISPQLTRYLVDNVLPGSAQEAAAIDADPALRQELLSVLLAVVGVLATVQTLRMVVNVINGRLAARIGTGITFDVRGKLVEHLEKLSIAYYDRQQVGGMVGRVAYDTEALHGFIWQLTGGFLLQLLMVVGVWIMMLTIDVRLALLALLPGPLVMGGTVFFWRHIYPRYYRVWDASAKQGSALSGMLSGIRVVKAFGQERRELERFERTSTRLRASRYGVDAGIASFNGAVGVLFQLGGWLVWYFGGREVLGYQLTLGDLMAFFGYLWMFYGPLASLPQLTSWLTQFVTQANRIFEVLDTPDTIPEPERPVSIRPVRGHIRFENVTFGYERHSPVLRDVSFEIQPGEMVGIVGPSGSGKTTTINLISRFYDVTEGRVLIDGVDVRDVAGSELRSEIGVVLQEPTLFRGTVADNISYGRPSASFEEVIEVAMAANCHDFTLRHPHAYDTWLGERGAGLSGGERQRIGIARTLLTDPRVLILDEATSSVDAESEAAIHAALEMLVRGRTTIAIAHRLSTLQHADRILVFDEGRLIEAGPHAELIRGGRVYRRMLTLQGMLREGAEDVPATTPHVSPEKLRARWLSPGQVRVSRGPHATMDVTLEGEPACRGAFALRCFPVHAPAALISLRVAEPSGKDRELGLIRTLDEWPQEARELIRESLRKRYFVHTIVRIHAIELVANHLNFDVETDLGPMEFTIRWTSDCAQDYGARGKIFLDVDGNQYVLPDVSALSATEQRLFFRYIYW